MAEVVIGRCHGGWGPDEGWVQVPSGTTVYLFLDSYREMHAEDAERGALMSPKELQGMQSKASQTVTQFRTVCNYGIQALTDDDVVHEGPLQQGVELVNEDGLHLADILQQHKGSNIYWFACQALDGLEPVVDGVDLDKLDLDVLGNIDVEQFGALNVDDLDERDPGALELLKKPDTGELTDKDLDLLANLQELLKQNEVKDLKDLKARKALSNKIQRF